MSLGVALVCQPHFIAFVTTISKLGKLRSAEKVTNKEKQMDRGFLDLRCFPKTSQSILSVSFFWLLSRFANTAESG